MIIRGVIKVLLILLIIVIFVPSSIHAKVLPKFLFEKALQESKDGDFLQAEKDWSYYLKEKPDDAAALSNRGNIRLALGDPEGAIRDQTKAIEISPEDLDPYLNRGIFKTEILQDHYQALKDFNKAIELNLKYSNAYYYRSLAKKKLGDISGYKDDIKFAASLGHEDSIEILNQF